MPNKQSTKHIAFFLSHRRRIYETLPQEIEGTGIRYTINEGSIEKAQEFLEKTQDTDFLFVQTNRMDIPVREITSLKNALPESSKLFIIGPKNDINIYRHLKFLGVDEYFPEEFSDRNIKRIISSLVCGNSLMQEGALLEKGKIITVLGARGGVGTSTLVSNIAFKLSKKNEDTALIGLGDTSGILSCIFGLSAPKNVYDFSSLLTENYSLMSLKTELEKNLSLFSTEIPIQDLNSRDFYENISDFIGKVSLSYSYTAIDVPHGIPTSLKAEVVRLSDIVIILLDPSILALKGMEPLHEALQIKEKIKKIYVLNMKDLYRQGEIPLALIEKTLGAPLDNVIKFEKTQALEAINQGKPVCTLSSGYDRTLDGLLHKIMGEKMEETSSAPFWKQFFHR